MRIPNRKACQNVSIGAFLRARTLPTVLTFNSLWDPIFSGLPRSGHCPPGVHSRQESLRNRTAICGSIPNFHGHPSLAVKSRLTLPYVELGERAGASVVVEWSASALFPDCSRTTRRRDLPSNRSPTGMLPGEVTRCRDRLLHARRPGPRGTSTIAHRAAPRLRPEGPNRAFLSQDREDQKSSLRFPIEVCWPAASIRLSSMCWCGPSVDQHSGGIYAGVRRCSRFERRLSIALIDESGSIPEPHAWQPPVLHRVQWRCQKKLA